MSMLVYVCVFVVCSVLHINEVLKWIALIWMFPKVSVLNLIPSAIAYSQGFLGGLWNVLA